MTQLVFDLAQSQKAKEKALAQVSETAGQSFMDGCLTTIGMMRYGDLVTGEDVRRACMDRGLEPHHSNAWGAVVRTAVGRGLLMPTGQWRKMTLKTSHARQTPVYRVL